MLCGTTLPLHDPDVLGTLDPRRVAAIATGDVTICRLQARPVPNRSRRTFYTPAAALSRQTASDKRLVYLAARERRSGLLNKKREVDLQR
jgi:hypothetical protein